MACGGPGNEGDPSTTPSSKTRPPDKTEVTMEVSPFDGGEPPSSTTSSASTSSGSVATSGGGGKSGSADPSEDPNIGGPQDATVEKAVAPIRPRLRACYKKALASEPSLAGTATFDAVVGKDGKVASARFVKREGLSEDMMGCLTTAVKAMTFEGNQKSVIVPFSFGNVPAKAGADAGVSADGGKR